MMCLYFLLLLNNSYIYILANINYHFDTNRIRQTGYFYTPWMREDINTSKHTHYKFE